MATTPPTDTAPDPDLGPQQARVRVRVRRRKHRRRRLVIAGGVVLLLVAIAGLSYFPASAARDQLLAGQRALQLGRKTLLGGDANEAHQAFEQALDHFIRASGSAGNPLLALEGQLPIVGRTPDAIRGLADAGQEVARAGLAVADSIAAVPGGISALAPSGRGVPIGRFGTIADGVEEAAQRTHAALAILRGTPGSLLLGPVAEARAIALAQVESLDRSFHTGATILRRLPAFLGAGGEQQLFFAAQNPAELRGTGGLLGAYSILRMDEGRFDFSDFHPIQDLPDFTPREVQAPSREYSQIYDRYGGPGFWLNLNMTPDFPSAALAIEASYAKATGQDLDGVIVADPFALRSMLEATGPVEIPELGVSLDASNVVPFTTNEAYSRFTNQAERKLVLGRAAGLILQRFLSTGEPAAKIAAVAKMVAGGHLLAYSDDPVLQEAFADAGVGGALRAPAGDFLSLVTNNGGGNKLDFYLDRSIDYTVQLGAAGSSSASATLTLRNDAPSTGLTKYVMGPFEGVSAAGENVSFVALYCPASCTFIQKDANVQDEDLGLYTERGLPFTWDYVRIPSGQTATLSYRLGSEGTWTGDESGGTYRLQFLNQPTVNPTHLRVEIQVPQGMHITSTNVAMLVRGGTATWDGVPERTLDLEVSFQAPLPSRLWNGLWQFLTRPVIHF